MWLRKSCGLRPQENMTASGREYGFLWLQRCCCLRQQPTVAASDRKSKRSSQWATQKMVSLKLIKSLMKSKLTIILGSPLWGTYTFAARGRHSWLLPKATTSLKSQKPIFAAGGRHIFLWPEATSLSKSHVPAKIGTMVTINFIEI